MKGLLTEVGVAVILANVVDNVTTYMALTASTPGVRLFEANPLADWGFQRIGMVPFLVVEFLLTAAILVWLIRCKEIGNWTKLAILSCLLALAGGAAINNFLILIDTGII